MTDRPEGPHIPPASADDALQPEPDDPEAQSLSEPQPIPPPAGTLTTDEPKSGGATSGAVASAMVGAGIFLSRIAGFVRTRVFAGAFGTEWQADVFNAGMRLPNVLQNLLGEGSLSASFIPVYSELLHEGRKEEAGKVAGAIFALLLAVAGGLALIGVLLAPALVSVFLAGWTGEQRELTVQVTRILFPMAGVLVLSAWSLGILNSHRYFFLSYFAPVLWNAAMIATLLLFADDMSLDRLVIALAWGALIGGGLQFLVQLPGVIRMERQLRIRWDLKLAGVREAVKNAGPAIMGRGVVQISGWLDTFLASFLAAGAVSTLGYAQMLYVLPVSLFGLGVAAAELPELSRQRGAAAEVLRARASGALERIAFYVIPSFTGYVVLGDVVVGGLYQTGSFGRDETLIVWATLAAFSVGLLATTASRLLSSSFFALRDTRTPARMASLRVGLSALLAIPLMLQFESVNVRWFDLTIPAGIFGDVRVGGAPLGPVGLALGGGIAAWVEWALLQRALRRRIGHVAPRASAIVRMLGAAALAAAAAWGVRLVLPEVRPELEAVVVLGVFGVVYLGAAAVLGLEQSSAFVRRFRNLTGRR